MSGFTDEFKRAFQFSLERPIRKINGKDISEMGCCGIYAAAQVARKDIQDVFDDYKRIYKKGPRWKGATNTNKLIRLLRDKYKVKRKPEGAIDWNSQKKISVRTFNKKWALPNRTYIIWISRHVMVLRNGKLRDQWHIGPVESTKKSLGRVKRAYWVVEK